MVIELWGSYNCLKTTRVANKIIIVVLFIQIICDNLRTLHTIKTVIVSHWFLDLFSYVKVA